MKTVPVIAHLRWNFQFGQDVIAGLLASETRPALEVTVVSADRPLKRKTIDSIDPVAVVGDSYHGSSVEACRDRGIPFIDLTGSAADTGLHRIAPDDLKIGRMAAGYLREAGIVHFAYIGFEDQAYSDRREKGFIEALAVNRIPVFRSRLSPFLLGAEEPGLATFLKGLSRPCGIFACSDLRALGLFSILRRREKRRDTGHLILGVDVDLVLRRITGFTIPSIDQAAWFQGWQAGQLIQRLLENPHLPPQTDYMPPIRVVESGHPETTGNREPLLQRFISGLKANHHHPDCLARTFREVPRSRRSIEALTRRLLGISPLQLLHRIRMKAVLELLENPDIPIAEVAQRTGFEHQGDLSRFVKRTLGVPPSIIRKGLLMKAGEPGWTDFQR